MCTSFLRANMKFLLSWMFFTGRNEVVAKVIFLQVCVCPQGGRVSASVHAGMPDPPGPPRDQADTPRDQADTPLGPGRHPPGTRQTPPQDKADPPLPRTRHTPPGMRQTSPHPPGTRHTPPRQADSSIRSTSGRYASYWNAFLFVILLLTLLYDHSSLMDTCVL